MFNKLEYRKNISQHEKGCIYFNKPIANILLNSEKLNYTIR